MKTPAALALAFVLAAVPAAAAADTLQIAAPSGWLEDPRAAAAIQVHMGRELPGDAQAKLHVVAWRSPEPGATLIVSTLTMPAPDDGWVRERLDNLRGTTEVMIAGGEQARTVSWKEDVRAPDRMIEANLEWQDSGVGTSNLVRALWIRPGTPPGTVDEYRAECVVADHAAALKPACAAALASLAPRLPVGERLEITAPAAVAVADEGDEELGDAGAGAGTAAPTIRPTETVGPVLASKPKQPEASRDLRPFFVVGGIIILAVALFWGRMKRKETLERAEQEEEARAKAKAEAGKAEDKGKDKGKGKKDGDS